MKIGRRCRCRRPAFTLVELLVVVAIIALLLAIFLPTFRMVHARVLRLRCQTNLAKCHKVMFQYAANNKAFLPRFSGSNGMEYICEGGGDLPFRCLDEIKSCGASAEIFTCPACPAYDNPRDYRWDSWRRPQFGSSSGSPYKITRTAGYIFFNGFEHRPPENRRLNALFSWGQEFPGTCDAPGNPPFACDNLSFDSRRGPHYKGWYHRTDDSEDEPGSGGHTIFLTGAVCWYDWEDLEEGLHARPQIQPAVAWDSWVGMSYFCGRTPRAD